MLVLLEWVRQISLALEEPVFRVVESMGVPEFRGESFCPCLWDEKRRSKGSKTGPNTQRANNSQHNSLSKKDQTHDFIFLRGYFTHNSSVGDPI